MEKLKVLFHVNDVDRWSIALGNITNLFRDVGADGADVVVLANGASVAAFVDADKIEEMKALAEKGAKFLVCISEEGLPAFVVIVPAGITAIIKIQNEGYAYVKP